MRSAAKIEARKRESKIKHHFMPSHTTIDKTNEYGFLGEFCFCNFLGIDWRLNIRSSYDTIDTYDLVYRGSKFDVKTETVPKKYATKILQRTIRDDEIFGRRLYSEGQFQLLKKYDYVAFGLIIREEENVWYPIGFSSAKYIETNYLPTTSRPDGGTYPSSGAPVKTSKLLSISEVYNLKVIKGSRIT